MGISGPRKRRSPCLSGKNLLQCLVWQTSEDAFDAEASRRKEVSSQFEIWQIFKIVKILIFFIILQEVTKTLQLMIVSLKIYTLELNYKFLLTEVVIFIVRSSLGDVILIVKI